MLSIAGRAEQWLAGDAGRSLPAVTAPISQLEREARVTGHDRGPSPVARCNACGTFPDSRRGAATCGVSIRGGGMGGRFWRGRPGGGGDHWHTCRRLGTSFPSCPLSLSLPPSPSYPRPLSPSPSPHITSHLTPLPCGQLARSLFCAPSDGPWTHARLSWRWGLSAGSLR